jgi:molecular chaperone DnaK
VHEKARAEMLISDAREAVADDNAPLDRIRSLTGEVQQAAQGLGTSAASRATNGGGTGQRDDQPADDDVIDAEFDRS